MAKEVGNENINLDEGAEIIAKQFIDALTGQGYEIYWRDNCVCPDEKTYLKMLTLKTGTMLLLGVKMIQLFSENKTKYDDFVMKLGLYLQLRDDYCNMGHEKDLEEMPGEEDVNADKDGYILEDITEGKFTLPAIYAMKTPEGPQVLSIIRQRTRDLELKKLCLSLLEKSGGMQYTRDLLMKIDKELRTEVLPIIEPIFCPKFASFGKPSARSLKNQFLFLFCPCKRGLMADHTVPVDNQTSHSELRTIMNE
ncbi:Geranylgeranyl diphosphate synthase-3-B-isoform [Danaus plexippus plexippus]|uniref:Geranylgeranyl diphosphate synthase-3-B-isoform n=1 Tax=Danaus plexippus plexippus TaxID=278856 RepID=A0A212ET06_DANPL|nr:Geranylgeranyl diphosphate synthase-3-B-isoform [Danaus plexippus plexippus]